MQDTPTQAREIFESEAEGKKEFRFDYCTKFTKYDKGNYLRHSKKKQLGVSRVKGLGVAHPSCGA
jgi:hypothetical protein